MIKQRTWEGFAEFVRTLHKAQKMGRKALRREWSAIRDLVEREVLSRLTQAEISLLLGKRVDELDPEENDLKALAAHAVGRGLLAPERLRGDSG